MALSFDTITSFSANVVAVNEANIATTISAMGPNPTTMDLLNMQTQLTKWTMATEMQSSITKTLGDALKGVIQKSG
jgi:hypothetical protein